MNDSSSNFNIIRNQPYQRQFETNMNIQSEKGFVYSTEFQNSTRKFFMKGKDCEMN